MKLFHKKTAYFSLVTAILLIQLGSVSTLHAQFYQGSQMTFGKNRVQYKDFVWSFYRFENYDTYFTIGGQELAVYTAQAAEKELADIEKFLDYKLDGRIQFLIYNKLSDLKQSNIGLPSDAQSNTGGVTRIVGNKIFLHFTGSHDDLRRQIREGIASVLLDQIMYGGDVKDRLQNAAMLSLPDWYIAGLVSYIGESWNVELDNKMRDGFISGRFKKFNRIEGPDAIIAGHSIWAFIAGTYGAASLPNVLYMTKSGRNIENGFLYVFGVSLKTLTRNWKDYYDKRYSNSDNGRTIPTVAPFIKFPRKNRIYNQHKYSPDGKYVAYTTNELGRYKVYLYNTQTKSRKVIMRGGYKTTSQKNDESFPVLAWHPTGKILSIIRERKGVLRNDLYTVDTKKMDETTLLNFEKVLDFAYSDDGQTIVMSAIQKGQSDIYVFNLRSRTAEQITRDFYDDLNPRFINGSKAIIFSSNRISDTLFVDKKNDIPPTGKYDIFVYDYKHKDYIMRRITQTPDANELQPMTYDKDNLAYLSDENGVVNRYVAHIDSVISSIDTIIKYRYLVNIYPQTDYNRNILFHDINPKRKKFSEVLYTNGKYRIYSGDEPKASRYSRDKLDNTEYKDRLIKEAEKIRAQSLDTIKKKSTKISSDSSATDSSKIDINNYIFQDEYNFPKNKKKKKEDVTIAKSDSVPMVEKPHDFALPQERIYEPAFSIDYFVTQLDNTFLTPSYQPFSPGGYINAPLGGVIKLGTSDLFEDYKIIGGFKIPFDLRSTEYFLSFENFKKRLDKQIVFHRATNYETLGGIVLGGVVFPGDYQLKVQTHEVQYVTKWPFSEIAAIRGTVGLRNDRSLVQGADAASLSFPITNSNHVSGKLEYIFDNTLPLGINLFDGTRYKLFAEVYKDINKTKTTMTVFGLDIRHYQKIHRELVWANRFAASTSQGSQKLLYYLGSVDNPLIPSDLNRFDYSTAIDNTQNYAYQALATNVRGFIQNVRNGNNFMVINSELRFPVFKYFFTGPIKSEFLRTFQVVPFTDIGTAWVGASPYKDNVSNTESITNGPLRITLTKQRDPFVYGYGFGFRAKVLGYFVRTDWAWGVEDGVIQPRIFYLSLNLDF